MQAIVTMIAITTITPIRIRRVERRHIEEDALHGATSKPCAAHSYHCTRDEQTCSDGEKLISNLHGQCTNGYTDRSGHEPTTPAKGAHTVGSSDVHAMVVSRKRAKPRAICLSHLWSVHYA